MINDSIKATGALNIILKDEYGNIKTTRNINNLVVTIGKVIVARRLQGDLIPSPNYMGIGSDGNTALAVQTTLISPVGSMVTTINTNVGNPTGAGALSTYNNIVRYSGTFLPGTSADGPIEVREAGLFSKISTGPDVFQMLARTSFLTVTKTWPDTLIINWEITIN